MNTIFNRMRKHLPVGIATVGTLLCFTLVAVDVVSAATYKTANGQVMIEAENYTRLGGSLGGKWTKSTAKPGFVGSGFMLAPSGDPRTLKYSSGNARVEYDINFTETGTYHLHLRSLATNHANNGFFATMNGRNFNYGHTHAYYIAAPWMGKWWWYSDGGGAEGRGYKVSINITKPGFHTLAIVRRDKGSRVDRIWLTKKVSVSPKVSSLNIGSTSTSTASAPAPTNSTPSSPTSSSPSTTTSKNGAAFVQSTSGLVAMDAFDYSATVSRSNHNWAEVRHLGIDAMEAIPDSRARIASGYTSKSPLLRFNVNFKKTGTHYIWLWASCQGSDNTFHVGLNGKASASSANIKVPLSKGWAWSSTTMGGARARVNVTRTGQQTVEVYMREDGAILRRIVMTTQAGYTPSGAEAATSDSGSSSTTSAAVAGKGFQQKSDASGLVVMNANNHDAKTSRSNHNWAAVKHLGTTAMESKPDNGLRIASGYTSKSPFLRFNVNFQKTGTHYIYLRAFCRGGDNTFYVGLNGRSGTAVAVPVTGNWTWSNRAAITVTKTGPQTVEVYMREDGSRLHKVLMTSSAGYKPSGSGPAQSVRK